jgi:hypothetical protein
MLTNLLVNVRAVSFLYKYNELGSNNKQSH